jgi:RNA polymerase sigma factor (sigma-70 family)
MYLTHRVGGVDPGLPSPLTREGDAFAYIEVQLIEGVQTAIDGLSSLGMRCFERTVGDNRCMEVTTPNDESDEALMARYANGDVRAFETLYDRHEKAMWRFVLRSVKAQSVADDVTQDIWFAVARNAATYRVTAKFRTWLFTMARNRVIDLSRTAKSNVSIDDETDDGEAMFSELAADSRLGPLRQLESKDAARELLDAVEQLPTDQREAFLLQAEGDMSVEEIAAATQVSFETAKSRLRYARAKLKSLLTPNSAPNEMLAEVRT